MMKSLTIDETKGLPVDWLLLMNDDPKRSRRRRAPSSTTFGSWSGTADFVVQRLLIEFRSESSKILNSVFAMDFSAGVHLHELVSERLERIVNCGCSLSPDYLSALLTGLLRWRETQSLDADRVKARVESATIRISLKDAMLLLDERHGSVVAYLFAFAALRLLDAMLPSSSTSTSSSTMNLLDTVALQIETVIFEVLRGGGSAPSAALLASSRIFYFFVVKFESNSYFVFSFHDVFSVVEYSNINDNNTTNNNNDLYCYCCVCCCHFNNSNNISTTIVDEWQYSNCCCRIR